MSSEIPTEVWIRNPALVVREAVEVGVLNFVWDGGYLAKRKMRLASWAGTYLPKGRDWRMFIILNDPDSNVEGRLIAQEVTPQNINDRDSWPTYPVWRADESITRLRDIVESQPTDREHRVFVTDCPYAYKIDGKDFFRAVDDLQSMYPDVIFHIHGVYSYAVMFGLHIRSVDIDPRTEAAQGRIFLPNGKKIPHTATKDWEYWIHLLSVDPASLTVPRNRCMFNMKSALWAARFYKQEQKFSSKKIGKLTRSEMDLADFELPVTSNVMLHKVKPKAGDKFLCDMCSLQLNCKYYREGAVCIVPDSEPTELARFFKTRDSGNIIDGLGTLMATQTARLKTGLAGEEESGKLDPEVTKIIKNLFDNGVKLAKLVDPSLAAAAAPKFQFNQQNNKTILTAANPQALMSKIVAELEARGVDRKNITPEMVRELMDAPEGERRDIIDATVVGGD